MAGKVFGVDLDTLVQKDGKEVPKIVSHILDYLNNKNAHLEEGLFRIPGNNIKITQLKKSFDTENNADLFKHKDLDAHTVACLFKMYLRELPVPCIIPRHYSTYLKVYQNPDPKQRLSNFRKLIMGLPKSNRLLLLTVLRYLNLVAENQKTNKMSTLNLALIFAPNLMRSEKETLASIMEDADKVAGTLQLLITEVEYLTSGKPPAWFSSPASAPLIRTKSLSSPPAPGGPQQLRREDSISEVLLGIDEDYNDNNNFTSTTTTTTSTADTDTPDTTKSSEEVITPIICVGALGSMPENGNAAVESTSPPIVESTTMPDEQVQDIRALSLSLDSIYEGPPTISPRTESALSELAAIADLDTHSLPSEPNKEKCLDDDCDDDCDDDGDDEQAEESPDKEGDNKQNDEQQQQQQQQQQPSSTSSEGGGGGGGEGGARPKLTSSLGDNTPVFAHRRRIRSLSYYFRSRSETSLTFGVVAKQPPPDEQVVAKSVRNMKALRASTDLTSVKPRRRLSIAGIKNQVFSSHQQLKSFAAMDK